MATFVHCMQGMSPVKYEIVWNYSNSVNCYLAFQVEMNGSYWQSDWV